MSVPRRPTYAEAEERARLIRLSHERDLDEHEAERLQALNALADAWDAHTRARSQRRKENAR